MNSEKPTPSTKIPDLYALLKITPKQDDVQLLRQALKRLSDRLERLDDRQTALRASKLMALAQQTLLDAKRKAAYDGLWEKVYGQQVVIAATPSNSMEKTSGKLDSSDRLASVLPQGDPMAPLDLASYLKSTSPTPPEKLRKDFDCLVQMLSGQSSLPESSDLSSESQATVQTGRALDHALVGGQTTTTSHFNPTTRNRSRRKRDQTYLLTMGGCILTLCCVLAVLYWMLNRAQQPSALSNQPTSLVAQESISAGSTTTSPPARRSRLPTVKGLEEDGSPPVTADPDAIEGDPPDQSSMEQMPNPQASIERISAEQGVTKSSAMTLSVEDRNRWFDLLTEIREQLRSGELNQAEVLILSAEPAAVSQQQQAQLARIKSILMLLKSYHQAVQDAASGLSAGQTLQIGSRLVAVVQADSQLIAVRVDGKNQTYPIGKLPLRLSIALAELSLSLDDPNALAIKAAHVSVSADTSPELLEKARKWMQAAIDARVVPSDMMAFFEDDYRLG